MSIGVKIENPETASLIMDALEKAKVNYFIWNAECLLKNNFNGPVEIECDDPDREMFKFIVDKIKGEEFYRQVCNRARSEEEPDYD